MAPELSIRTAAPGDAGRISEIGAAAMRAQYADLVDPAAVDAAVEQTYSIAGLRQCIVRCSRSDGATFLVASHQDTVVGYLHFDSFGPEPELHRLYVDPAHRSRGTGAALMRSLHAGLADRRYMLLVVAGNQRAVSFYQRHGLDVEEHVDGLSYYRDRMGVAFPEGTRPFQLVLMRQRTGGGSPRRQR